LALDFQARTAARLALAAMSGAARLAEAPLYARDPAGRSIELTDGADFEITAASVRLPRRADRVWVLGFVRFPDLLPQAAPTSPGTWPDWPDQARTTLRLARILAGLGYLALPSAGGLFPAAPLAALAGLGEVGRPGLLVTPEYGPNIRLLAIITDFPFQPGLPALFGLADYCETCRRCLAECPAKALAEGPRRPGLWPWPVDFKACLDHRLAGNESCRKCIEACPLAREPLIAPSAGPPRGGL
jgi:ferredoxin